MPAHNSDNPVLIIGGGAAGLSTAAALARQGIHATVLERDNCIGGSWSRRYTCLRLHTTRCFSGLAHYPIPKDRPRYLSKDDYAAYLKHYAEELDLDISPGEQVETVRQIHNSCGDLNWQVVTNRGTRTARVIIIATGQSAEAILPDWEGMEDFTGTIIHSSQYTIGAEYTGQDVLVAGLGNSGAEIAADLATHGARHVSVAVRSTPPIVTREMFGIVPVQLFGIIVTAIGLPCMFDRIGTVLRRFAIGDLSRYGLGDAAWGPFTSKRPAVIDAGFLAALKRDHIKIRPEIACFEPTRVVYIDGTRESVNSVIIAVGYRTGLEKFLKVPGMLDDSGQPLFRSASPTPAKGLYFIGFGETVRGQLFEIKRESLQLAAEIRRYLEMQL